ncbi:probable serine/threonine-protein kinase DDB_G0271682 isoform X3 [Stylophora pistillata]|uniref:probable serine/threonine-protein kinase DDB_G0271682 isoform X3 n=1 Tax=Stylophora pistillata TaxID=50429 RepID=UPI000C0520C9|nr:probable serine/threonine-protein kinase DDB_G0271682 isoform X3 [Stylophora pistillata]
MANGLKEMVVELLSIKDGAFEEIRALWIESVDTTGVETVGELFEKFEKEKGRMLSAEDVKELLWNLSYVDIKEKVFADDAPWRPQNSSSRIWISTSLGSAPDGAPTTGGPGALMVTGQTAVTVSNLVTSSHDFARQQRIPGLSRTLHGRNCYLQEKLKTARKEIKALGAMLRTGEESLEREMKLSRTLHGENRYLQEKLKVTLQEKEEILGQKNVEIRSPEQRMSVASRAGYHRTSFKYVATSGPANLEINSSSALTPIEEFNLVVTEGRAMKAPVMNQSTASQWQTSTHDVSEVQKLREENADLITQLRSQERSSEVNCEEIKNLNQKLSEAGIRCHKTEKELRHKDDMIKQLSAERQQLCENRKQDLENFEQQIQQKTAECQAECESLLWQLNNFHLTQRTAREAILFNQVQQAIAERERQFEERHQQIERVARENCALHQQPEERSWIVPRHEVVVYREQEPLGRNSWGIVYRGKFGGCPVAVKELHGAIDSPHSRRLFYREMEMLSRARNKNILQFIAGVFDDGLPWIVTEVANGGSLAMILENRALQPSELFSIASDVAQGILSLHRHPVPMTHGDIKPGNVFIFQIGEPPGILAKLGDMGNANFVSGVEAPDLVSPVYLAPETQTQQFTTKADVYSFGLVLMEMNIRKPPVPGEIQRQVEQVTNTFMRQLIRRCTATNPDDRPDMERVANELEQCELNDSSHGFN